jgi:hypothetical protein
VRRHFVFSTLAAAESVPPKKKIPRNVTRYRGSFYLRAGDRTRTGDVQLGKLNAMVSCRFLQIP